jgi:kynureninase
MTYNMESLRKAYGEFLRPDRILLSGHSHQAWPDVARAALVKSFDDAAQHVDDKWAKAVFPVAQTVREKILERMGFDRSDCMAFGESSHQLVYRLLSCLPLQSRPRVVASTGEFHSLYRQLARLGEEGFDVVWVDASDRASLAQKMIAAIDENTRLVALSAVMFEDAYVVREIGEVMNHAVRMGAIPLVDAYHAFNAVPMDWGPASEQLYVTAGGYKYAGFGNGLCWLRFPSQSTLRPRYTGWFADFDSLADPRGQATAVRYGAGSARFAGATFDDGAFYRAAAVLEHWERFDLDVASLREVSLRQTRRVIDQLKSHNVFGASCQLVSSEEDERRGAFVTVRLAAASRVVERMRERHVWVDARGELLRFGPAPYVSDDEIDAGIKVFAEVLREG